jgi:uncharacterized membrane protein
MMICTGYGPYQEIENQRNYCDPYDSASSADGRQEDEGVTMKKNVFYLIIIVIAAFEIIHFGWSIGTGRPLLFVAGLLLGIAVIYLARMYVDEVVEDERTQKIREKTALSTLQISGIALLALSLWMIIEGAGNRPNLELRRVGLFGLVLLLVDVGMIIVYILLSFYYRKQFGE